MIDGIEERKLIGAAKLNPENFATLYDFYVTSIYRYLIARTRHKETAEDLTSQTFLQAFKAFPNYEVRGLPFGAWLFKIAKNLLINNSKRPESLALETADTLAVTRSDEEVDYTLA